MNNASEDFELGPILGVMIGVMMLAMLIPQAEAGEPARLSGNVSDSEGSYISGIKLSLSPDGQQSVTGSDGHYEFNDLFPEIVYLSVDNAEDLGYNPMPLTPIDLVAGSNIADVVLTKSTFPPEPPPPQEDGWTEGIVVREIIITPSIAYVGEVVNIDVAIGYQYPLPLPADVSGKVTVNGTELTNEWTITFRNPRLRFKYTATAAGEYTVTAKDKMATLTVLADPTSTYYMPWGGVRMPACIQVTIPNVEPFEFWGEKFEGGDYLVDGFSDLKVYNVPQLIEGLKNAYPSKWDPPGAIVNNWVTQYRTWYGGYAWPPGAGLVVMATEYTCQEHWNSKEELTKILARAIGGVYLVTPIEWVLEYGTTCPTCGGTGIVSGRRCWACYGNGKIYLVDLRLGWRDWAKSIRHGSVCGGGKCTPYVYCPYCDRNIEGSQYTRALPYDKVSFMRRVLRHIETAHPGYPLTEQPWT